MVSGPDPCGDSAADVEKLSVHGAVSSEHIFHISGPVRGAMEKKIIKATPLAGARFPRVLGLGRQPTVSKYYDMGARRPLDPGRMPRTPNSSPAGGAERELTSS